MKSNLVYHRLLGLSYVNWISNCLPQANSQIWPFYWKCCSEHLVSVRNLPFAVRECRTFVQNPIKRPVRWYDRRGSWYQCPIGLAEYLLPIEVFCHTKLPRKRKCKAKSQKKFQLPMNNNISSILIAKHRNLAVSHRRLRLSCHGLENKHHFKPAVYSEQASTWANKSKVWQNWMTVFGYLRTNYRH